MIQVENLVKTYGDTVAVDHASFRVKAGEIAGFLGPNGAGKTTTLRILTCFMPATEGTATVGGHDVHDESLAVRRLIGYLPENVPVYPEMRVHEFLDYRARLKGISSRAERRRKIDEAMTKCGVVEVRRRLCGQLSKGYRQRVGLADCLLHDPKILILDEPTVGLDPNQIRETRRLIKELGRDHTVLVSTHILPEVEMMASSIIIIHEGRIAAHGTPAQLKKKHARRAHLRLEVRAPDDEVVREIRSIEGVADVQRRSEDGRSVFEIDADGGRDLRPRIARHVAKKGWDLVELHRHEPTLEEVFVRITLRED